MGDGGWHRSRVRRDVRMGQVDQTHRDDSHCQRSQCVLVSTPVLDLLSGRQSTTPSLPSGAMRPARRSPPTAAAPYSRGSSTAPASAASRSPPSERTRNSSLLSCKKQQTLLVVVTTHHRRQEASLNGSFRGPRRQPGSPARACSVRAGRSRYRASRARRALSTAPRGT